MGFCTACCWNRTQRRFCARAIVRSGPALTWKTCAAREVSIRNIVCSVDLTPHSNHTASFAAEIGRGRRMRSLTLVHITTGVEVWGPGGLHVDIEWKDIIVDNAIKGMADLQRQVGTHAEVIIDSGNVPKLLNQAAERIEGRRPGYRTESGATPSRGQRRRLWDHSGIAHPGPKRLRPRARCRICWCECRLRSASHRVGAVLDAPIATPVPTPLATGLPRAL
jgi:hypothetical protein